MSGVVLVTTFYWPDPTGISPYATEMAEHLAAQGRRVQVLTTLPHYPRWQLAPGDRRTLHRTEHRNGVEIIRLWLRVPRRQTLAQRALYELSFLAHAEVGFRRPKEADRVVSVVPNLANGIVGAHLARTARPARHVLVVQDLSGRGAAQSGVGGGAGVAGTLARLESAVIRRADVVAIASPGFRPHLVSGGVRPDRIVDFPNWCRLPPSIEPRSETRTRFGWQPHEKVILHAGNMGMKQGLEAIAAYAREAAVEAPALRFVLVGDGSQRDTIEALVRDAPNVDMIPPVPEEQLPGMLAAADVLLVNERPTLLDMSLPSKLTAYFTAGRPVVAAVAPGGATATEVVRSGAGAVAPGGDPVAVVRALRDLAGDAARCEAVGRAGRRYAEEVLGREAALRRLDHLVDGGTETPQRRRSA